MENKALKTVEKYNMLSHGDIVIIGLSGGADSCALFYFLLSLRQSLGLNIIACHVNHMLRGEEADRDEMFVKKLCEENSVEFRLLRTDVAARAKELKESTEKCGRDIRYAFFEKTAGEYGGKIATAHTASDNAETVLFNLTRGCGIRGLCGIPPVRGNIVRPLIEVTRAEIEEYCNEHGYKFITDSSNLEREYTRNILRLDVIPVLKEINPSFEENISGMTQRMMCNAGYLYTSAEKVLACAYTDKGYKADVLYNCNDAVFAEVIAILTKEFGIIPEAKHIKLIKGICSSSGAVEIKSKIYAVSNQGFLRIIRRQEEISKEEITYSGQDLIVISDKKFKLSVVNIEEFHKRQKNNKFLFNYCLDYDTIAMSGMIFRFRRSGDKFRLPKRNITKSLKRLFNELKIPRDKRESILVLADGSEVLWIEGIGTSESCTVKTGSKRVLMIQPCNFDLSERV